MSDKNYTYLKDGSSESLDSFIKYINTLFEYMNVIGFHRASTLLNHIKNCLDTIYCIQMDVISDHDLGKREYILKTLYELESMCYYVLVKNAV